MWSILSPRLRRLFSLAKPRASSGFFVVFLTFFLGLFVLAPQGAFAQSVSTLTEAATANFILLIAQAIQFITGALGSFVLIIIDILTVYILGYNGFSSSSVIGLGWSLVRDVVNMFVVLILLFIAIRTILGLDKSSWQQSLPRLFLAVVLVNFSRTICGLLIDFSQIVMFTFVNALIDIAAGNFAQMLGLQNYGLVSIEKVEELGGNGQSVFASANVLASSYLQLALYGAIVAVLLMLTLAFLWRIIVLWILVIMSPLAFFMNSMKGVLSFAGGVGGQWWSKFTAALTLGPLLAFFLWLSLAAASSGNVAASGGFNTDVEEKSYGLTSLENLETDNIFSLLLALALLVVGMQQAASSAQSLGGVAGTVINEGVGKKIVGAAVTLPGRAAGYAVDRGGGAARGFAAGTGVGQRLGLTAGSGRLSTDAMKLGGSASLGTARVVQGVPILGAAAGGLATLGGSLQNRAGARQSEELKGVKDQIKTESADQYAFNAVQMMKDVEAGKNPVTAGGNRKHDGRMTDFMFNPAQQKKAQDLLTTQLMRSEGLSKEDAEKKAKGQTDEFIKKSIADLEANGGSRKNDLLDDAGKAKLNDLKSKNLHLLEEKDMEKFVKSTDFTASKMSDDAVNNATVQKILSQEQDRNVKDNVTYMDRVRDGKYTARIKPSAQSDDEARLSQAIASGRIKPTEIKASEMSGANGDNVVGAMLVSPKVDATVIAALKAPEQQAFNERAKRQRPEKIREGIKNGSINVNALSGNDVDSTRPESRNMAAAVLLSSPAVLQSIQDASARTRLAEAVEDFRKDATFTVSQATQAEESLLAAGERLEDVIKGVQMPTPSSPAVSFSSEARPRVAQLIERDPVNARHLSAAINAGGANDATAAVVSAIKKDSLNSIATRFRDAVGQEQEQIRLAMKDLGTAIAAEKAKVTAAGDQAEIKRVTDLEKQHSAASRYIS
ncbi:hypothetical protein KBC55_04305 [Patescibacteria group bacterium]|nr:hypothetical protein [Patescibacteria group bacterium]